MSPWLDTLALAGSPAQWAAIALMGVLIFAPQVLPRLARWFGRLAAGDGRGRQGLGRGARRRPGPAEPELLPPERPGPTLRSSDPTPLSEDRPRSERLPEHDPPRRAMPSRPSMPAWLVPAVVCAAIGVILWLLLHGR